MNDQANTDDWSGLPGRLIVVSGPSGSGKTSLVRRYLARPDAAARLSISATTRPPRPGEEEGRDYVFLDRMGFEAARDRGEFLESADVHGQLYGTPSAPVRRTLERGDCVILEIDVQGALQVRRRFPSAVLIFVNTSTFAVLEKRLRDRSTEDEATTRVRLNNARREIAAGEAYDHHVINEDLEQAVNDLARLLSRLGCGGPTRDA